MYLELRPDISCKEPVFISLIELPFQDSDPVYKVRMNWVKLKTKPRPGQSSYSEDSTALNLSSWLIACRAQGPLSIPVMCLMTWVEDGRIGEYLGSIFLLQLKS